MKSSFLFCTVPVSFVILPGIGLLLFTSGFFLTRVGIETKSGSTIPLFSNDPEARVLTFDEFARFNRVVILLIDALRYDFVKPITREDISLGTEIKPYHNHMNTIARLTESSPRHAKLYKFLADPPTTTMQRIKALTTGSLPTFVDQTSNFNSPRITEDSLLQQVISSGRHTLFAGDDTWMDLFPDSFSEAHPYPSFNVKDLHTVDEGVIRHLFPFLERSDWSLLIGHFLGVDHCGHIYGPDHSTMKDKLIQLDGVISSVVKRLPDDALLVVMGDHGMTETGDHGGDTSDETHAALFLYSSRPLTPSQVPPQIINSLSDSVSQKNIVPTLSLLLGLPIPYSNLGSLIPELFLSGDTPLSSLSTLSRALLLNCVQVWRYLTHYSRLSSDIPLADMTSFQLEIDSIISLYNSDNFNSVTTQLDFVEKCTEFLRRSESLCQSIWAKFSIPKMIIGISILIFSTLLQTHISASLSQLVEVGLTHNIIVLASCTYVLLASFLVSTNYLRDHVEDDLTIISLNIFLISLWLVSVTYILHCLLASRNSIIKWLKQSVSIFSISTFCFSIISSLSLFSNSYIIWEDSRLGYLLQTYNFILLLRSLSVWYAQSKENKNPIFASLVNPCLLIGLMGLTRLFRLCRPEQFPCESSLFSLPLLNLAEKSLVSALLRLFLSVSLLTLPVLTIHRKYKLNWCYSTCLFSLCFLIVLFWITRSVPEPALSPRLLSLYYTSAPRIVYIVSILLFFYSIRNLWNIKPKIDSKLSSFSLHYSCICLVVWLLSCLLVGDGMVPSLSLLILYLAVLSRALSGYGPVSPLFLSHYWFLLSSKFYFTIGHQFTVQSIRYEAAFTGFHGHLDSFIIAGFLIGINMFATYICNIFFLPLFLFECDSIQNSKSKGRNRNETLSHAISCTMLQILCLTNFQVLLACAVAFTHRRHLMVWNVFAPRFVYEAVIYCVLVATIFVVYSIVYPTVVSFNVKERSSIKLQ